MASLSMSIKWQTFKRRLSNYTDYILRQILLQIVPEKLSQSSRNFFQKFFRSVKSRNRHFSEKTPSQMDTTKVTKTLAKKLKE